MVRLSGESVYKGFRHGTHRAVPPDETTARVRPLLPAMGITRLANVTGLDVLGIPVVMAHRPNSRGLSVAQGKGLTLDAARASAAMEAIEAYHAEHVSLPLLLRSHTELQADSPVVDVVRLSRTRSEVFDPDRRVLWVEGLDLLGDGPKWLPFDLVHLDFTYETRAMAPMFEVGSNGLASGNHRTEALGHALAELVERDAVARWYDDDPGRAGSRLDLGTVDDAACREMIARAVHAGFRLLVHDLTGPFGVAVIRCELVEDPRLSLQPICAAGGFGCHPDRGIALSRAITEAAQSRLTLIAGSRDDMFHADYRAARDRDGLAARWEAAAGTGVRSFASVPTYRHELFDDDVALLLDRIRATGVREAVAVDLSQPRFELPVVRVVVPGLRDAPRHGTATP